MLTTIKDFCNERGVSRQHVYQEIKRGKHTVLELPIFVQYQEKYMKIGSQKFINADTENSINDDFEWAKNTAKKASKDPEIRLQIEHLLSPNLDESEKDSFKTSLFKIYASPHAKATLLTNAFDKLSEILKQQLFDVQLEVSALQKEIN